MTPLTKALLSKCEFDEASLNETAKMIVNEIEALAWADNWSVHKGIPLVVERFKYENARLMPLILALAECVDCLEELKHILDGEHLDEIDSFTAQPARLALERLKGLISNDTNDSMISGDI